MLDWGEKMESQESGPLRGLQILDLGNMIAGPMAGCLLGDFGADVVKVEHPITGDDLRNWPPMNDGRSLWWKVTARNKKLITLDLSKPRGQALLKRMLRSSDPWARAAATRVLCYWRDRVADPLALLKLQANDPHPAVRLEAVRAASFFQSSAAAAVAMESLNHPQDRFLTYTLDQAMKTLDRFIK